MDAAIVTLSLAVVLLAVLVFGVLRNQARMLRVLEGLRAERPPLGPRLPPREGRVGVPAPALAGVSATGAAIDVAASGRVLVAFLTTSCTTCQSFWAGSHATWRGAAGRDVVIVTPSPELESRRRVRELAPSGMTVLMSGEAWTAYGASGSPWFVAVADGTIQAEGTAADWTELQALVGS